MTIHLYYARKQTTHEVPKALPYPIISFVFPLHNRARAGRGHEGPRNSPYTMLLPFVVGGGLLRIRLWNRDIEIPRFCAWSSGCLPYDVDKPSFLPFLHIRNS